MTFQKGQIANPTGKGGGTNKGWTPYGKRASILMDMVSMTDILETPVKELEGKYGNRDIMIILHLRKVYGDMNGEERERLLNRIEGQAKQSVDITLAGDSDSPINLALLSKTERRAMREAINKAMGKQSALDDGEEED